MCVGTKPLSTVNVRAADADIIAGAIVSIVLGNVVNGFKVDGVTFLIRLCPYEQIYTVVVVVAVIALSPFVVVCKIARGGGEHKRVQHRPTQSVKVVIAGNSEIMSLFGWMLPSSKC